MKYEKRHHKIHVPAPDDRDQRYCVTSTGGSNIHCFDTLDGAFEWIRSNETTEKPDPYAQGLTPGDRVMCWDDDPANAVMRMFYGVVDTHPTYTNVRGELQRFRFARPMSEYIKYELGVLRYA